MPVPRRSEVRRRIYRVSTKWTYDVVARRFKLLQPTMIVELDWELEVLDAIEESCYKQLDLLNIPTEDRQYYVGYAKRLWERRLKFDYLTYFQERTSLRNEYIMRGWAGNVLDLLEVVCEYYAAAKKLGPPLLPMPPPFGLCQILSDFFLTVAYKFVCSPQTVISFAYRYPVGCQLQGIGEYVTPEKVSCSLASTYSLSVV